MTKGQLKSILANLEANEVPDSTEIAVRVLSGEKMVLNGNSFFSQGADAEVSLDAQNHWAAQVTEPEVIFLKQE